MPEERVRGLEESFFQYSIDCIQWPGNKWKALAAVENLGGAQSNKRIASGTRAGWYKEPVNATNKRCQSRFADHPLTMLSK